MCILCELSMSFDIEWKRRMENVLKTALHLTMFINDSQAAHLEFHLKVISLAKERVTHVWWNLSRWTWYWRDVEVHRPPPITNALSKQDPETNKTEAKQQMLYVRGNIRGSMCISVSPIKIKFNFYLICLWNQNTHTQIK